MIPQLSKALSSGFTSKQIMDFILKKFPQHRATIQNALTSGFTADQVLKYLAGGKKALSMPEEQAPEGATEFQQTRNRDISRREDVNKKGIQAAGLVGAGLAAPMAATALQHALPNSLKPMTAPLTTALQQQTQQSQPQQPPIQNVNDVTNVTQQQVKPQLDFAELKKTYKGFFDKIDDLKNSGNNPDAISAFFRKFSPSQSEKFEKQTGMKLEEIVQSYIAEGSKAQEQAPIEEMAPAAESVMESPSQKLPHSVPEEKIENVPIAKNETVSTPHGVGEVKEIRNGKAIVEVNGKKHQVDEEELEASPLPEKDLAALYDELIQGIEGETGEDVSRMVQWAGYNPETNTLQFLPHTGKLYKYGNISPEDAALLTDILSTRKTSGENFIGAWKAGSKSPIGAALSKLIRKLQAERGGKGQEYEETHEPIYSAYEPAVQAAKKKKKKK